ncbi:MAG: SDR family oxidoreductase [Clostridiales bacterium]|nr:SDR family oxidoreductase [Clostridiales bacterium]
MAPVCLFLLSDDSRTMTGHDFYADNGYLAFIHD